MFRFENPEYFYALVLLPLLALAHYLWVYEKKRKLKQYGDPALLKALMTDVSHIRTEIKFWLLQFSILFLIIALARPQYGTRVDTRKRSGIEAIIALDISNSMLAEDVRPNRLEKAKMMVSHLVDNMTDDKIGLIVYAGQAYVQLPITSDYVSAKMFLETISTSMIEMQGTDIAAAISLASRSFTKQDGVSRAVFVITDGEDNEGGAVAAARAAAEAGIHVYVLGIGSPGGAPIPLMGTGRYITDESGNTVMSHLDEDMCREIANAGNGNYIYVDNSSSAQKKLDKYVDNLGRVEMESSIFSEYDEQFQGFLLLSLLFLLLDAIILERENHVLQRFTFFTPKR
ncbi:MAG: VWA domain-containing protein [Bacteroidaceae bacterium]|nr:VWA domain-containing protein [Bacteroidaceae bacterium]